MTDHHLLVTKTCFVSLPLPIAPMQEDFIIHILKEMPTLESSTFNSICLLLRHIQEFLRNFIAISLQIKTIIYPLSK